MRLHSHNSQLNHYSKVVNSMTSYCNNISYRLAVEVDLFQTKILLYKFIKLQYMFGVYSKEKE